MTQKRDILHVVIDSALELGIEDMEAITKAFAKAVYDPEINVVVTSSGIQLKVLSLAEGEHVRYIQPDFDGRDMSRLIDPKETTVFTTTDLVELKPEMPELKEPTNG